MELLMQILKLVPSHVRTRRRLGVKVHEGVVFKACHLKGQVLKIMFMSMLISHEIEALSNRRMFEDLKGVVSRKFNIFILFNIFNIYFIRF
jgi:hypothetical protein